MVVLTGVVLAPGDDRAFDFRASSCAVGPDRRHCIAPANYSDAPESNGTVVAWGKEDAGQTTIPIAVGRYRDRRRLRPNVAVELGLHLVRPSRVSRAIVAAPPTGDGEALDAYGHTATGYRGQISSQYRPRILPAKYTFTAATQESTVSVSR